MSRILLTQNTRHFALPLMLGVRWRLDNGRHSEKCRGGIPIVGRLTVLELLGFVGLIVAAAFGALEFLSLWPLLEKISAPGSGGAAQMLLAMLVFPLIFAFGSVVVSGIIGFILLLGRVKARLAGRNRRSPIPALALDPGALRLPMQVLTASLVVQVLGGFLPSFLSTTSIHFNVAFALVIMAAGLVFLIHLGILAARLRRNWAVWVILTAITPPFGPFVAYFMMRKAIKDEVGRDTSAT